MFSSSLKKLPAVFFEAHFFLNAKKREKGCLHPKFFCFPRKQLKVIFDLYRRLYLGIEQNFPLNSSKKDSKFKNQLLKFHYRID